MTVVLEFFNLSASRTFPVARVKIAPGMVWPWCAGALMVGKARNVISQSGVFMSLVRMMLSAILCPTVLNVSFVSRAHFEF